MTVYKVLTKLRGPIRALLQAASGGWREERVDSVAGRSQYEHARVIFPEQTVEETEKAR